MTRPPKAIPPCLVCRQAPGHGELCPSDDDEATYYLQHPLPDGHRDWTPAGIRYTGTPARRTAVRAVMATTCWVRMHGKPNLPMLPGLLINQILAGFGSTASKTSRIGYTSDFLTTLDCRCDPWRCIHDHDAPNGVTPDWLTHPRLDPDLVVYVPLVAVEIRWADLWQTYWFADAGGGAVSLAIDSIPEISPPGITVACHRRWCDLCPGSSKPGPRAKTPTPCPCSCHAGTPS